MKMCSINYDKKEHESIIVNILEARSNVLIIDTLSEKTYYSKFVHKRAVGCLRQADIFNYKK